MWHTWLYLVLNSVKGSKGLQPMQQSSICKQAVRASNWYEFNSLEEQIAMTYLCVSLSKIERQV